MTVVVLVAAWVAILAAGGAGAADGADVLEQRVKAAFLYQFASYVEWPRASFAQPDSPLTIGVIGPDVFATELDRTVSGRTVGGRAVSVRRIRPGEQLAGVHVLFVGDAESARLGQLTQAAQARPILVVTESERALDHGSMINFVLEERRVRFEVALDTAEKSGLRLSSRLLAVARDVRMGGQ